MLWSYRYSKCTLFNSEATTNIHLMNCLYKLIRLIIKTVLKSDIGIWKKEVKENNKNNSYDNYMDDTLH